MNTPISWFELPTTDLARATAFYQKVFACQLHLETMGDIRMAIFPHDELSPGGALVAMPQMQPADNGTLVYLAAGDDLNTVLARIPAAGGQVLMPKTDLGNDIGFIALFLDCEGNRVGLYSKH
ncbi:VOC family protein [Azonexus sp. IMCC34839]|uniref:VOC family protein n=1 Tax=Azonexus sp. IMCC34839 TaxID=3133695 RepID=UPI00399B41E9